ncbi:PP2C family protein-serine/threonine phosphatase [Aeoliella sp.]|uniref:PP2C family protein-serine/threonine phosphatase n=1 Tax=Aeoliella sp. TaxID=2795800 RepID=UPI003CCBFDD7
MTIPKTISPDVSTFEVHHAALSDLGMRRANNQDAMAVAKSEEPQWQSRGHFFMVADGMGAHAAGELASKLAVDNVPHTYQKLRSLTPPAALRQAVHKANKLIFDKGQSAAEFNGMGTTCSCLVLLPNAALIAHVGDSRVYRLRCNDLEQLTFDHSLVWEMAAASDTADENVPACIPKNVITRSLGPHPMVNVDLEGPYDVCPGDKFLLCSDGLTGVVDNDLIATLLQSLEPQEAAATLVDIANLRGGPDNITVIVAQVAGDNTQVCAENGKPACCDDKNERSWLGKLFGWIFGGTAGPQAYHELGGPYGNGPYRHYESHPATTAVEMAGLCRELAELEHAEHSPLHGCDDINWSAFHQQCSEAQKAGDAKEPTRAIQLYAQAIRTLMDEVRRHDASATNEDSVV